MDDRHDTRSHSSSSSSGASDGLDSPMSYAHIGVHQNQDRKLNMEHSHSHSGEHNLTSNPESPSASAFLRTAETLDGLAKQLVEIQDDSAEGMDTEVRCCCGFTAGGGGSVNDSGSGSRECRMMRDRERMEDKLKLSGEVGHALLQRYEALERKYQREVEKFEKQLEVKRTSMAESLKRVNNLEKANHQHLQRFADMSKKTEALEKRYTQAMHTQTLTQQSLTHVRAELTTLRATTARQNIALASGAGVEQRLADAEKRYEDARDLVENEVKKTRDEMRKRKRAEARIEELEIQVKTASKEVDDIKEARAKDAQDLLANAKERLSVLHFELSETFHAESPADMPEYQRTLEDLVANNALLKHDVAELSHSLTESRDESRVLKEEVEELRSVIGTVGRMSPFGRMPQHLASELGSGQSNHTRTESSPVLAWGPGHGDRTGSWQRMSVASSSRTGGMSSWEHHRKMSMAASFTSTSTADGITSPGLGMGPIGEFGGVLVNEDGSRVGALSPPPADGRHSPKIRTSPGPGIGYIINGVPKIRPGHARPPLSRSFSTNTDRRQRRSYASQGVGPIAEWAAAEEDGHENGTTDEPPSPGSEYFRAANANRKRRSLMLARRSTMSPHESTELSPSASNTLIEDSITDYPSPISDSVLTNPSPKRAKRKTLMLLTRSQAVQTDPVDIGVSRVIYPSQGAARRESSPLPAQVDAAASTGTSPNPPSEDRSETSSVHDNRAGILLVLIEHMSRMLARLRDADVPTLNKRLKKHNLPGDVSHLSQSTMRNLQLEVSELRNHFKGSHNFGAIDRKDFNLLLRLLKDVFSDLVDLQAIVNDVTITPSLAKKLQRAAFRDDEDEAAKAAKAASGLGWIAAPITKFFVTPAETGEGEDSAPARSGKGLERGRLQPMPVRSAPKQQATASATTTHVSVEFGGTGIVRRATPAMVSTAVGAPVNENLPPSPVPVADNDQYSKSNTPASGNPDVNASGNLNDTLAPPALRTVRRSKSRANRNELLGIFAGAAQRPPMPTGAESYSTSHGGHGQFPSAGPGTSANGADSASGAGGRTFRATSAQQFADRTIRANPNIQARKRISAAVDAVIDNSANQLDDSDPSIAISGSYEPPLLERTLRPRGLSDSSIRSTFVSHSLASPVDGLIDSGAIVRMGRAAPYAAAANAGHGAAVGGATGGGGVFQTLSKRWYDFRGPTAHEVPPATHAGTGSSGNTHSKPTIIDNPNLSSNTISAGLQGAGTSPARAIPSSPSGPSTRHSSISTTSSRQLGHASPISTSMSATTGTTTTTSRGRAISPITLPSSQGTGAGAGTGIFGILASSLAANSGVGAEDGEEDEMVGASLRQPALVRGRSTKSWQ